MYWLCLCWEYWCKGDIFGYIQVVYEVCFDCDGDVILLLVVQIGFVCYMGMCICFDMIDLGVVEGMDQL